MRKILLFAILLPAYVFAGEWTKVVVEPDELLGVTESYTKHIYKDGEKAFVISSDKLDHFYIVSPHVLNCQNENGRVGCYVKIGLYDLTNKLLDGFDMYLGKRNNQCTAIGTFECDFMSQPVGQQKKTRKILKHLRGDSGYVRIVVDTYMHGLYDLRVPVMK